MSAFFKTDGTAPHAVLRGGLSKADSRGRVSGCGRLEQ